MTTIAWDGKFLAVDRQNTSDSTRRVGTKARPALVNPGDPPKIFAWAGCGSYGKYLCEWYEEGANLENWPKFQNEGDDHAALIVATARQVEVFTAGVAGHPDVMLAEENPFYAWGSGYRLAIGAMAAGKDAREAVQIASRFDVFTSPDIIWFPL